MCSQPEEMMWYFRIQGVAGLLCTMAVWQEAQTPCSLRLSRPRDNPGLDLNMARQEGDSGDVARESLQSSSSFLMPAHILVCLIRSESRGGEPALWGAPRVQSGFEGRVLPGRAASL